MGLAHRPPTPGSKKVKIGNGGIEVGDFFHQLHHRFFDCNYGTWETPWDT